MTLHGDINLLYLGFQYKCAVIIMCEWREAILNLFDGKFLCGVFLFEDICAIEMY